jgi:hypothetical protein
MLDKDTQWQAHGIGIVQNSSLCSPTPSAHGGVHVPWQPLGDKPPLSVAKQRRYQAEVQGTGMMVSTGSVEGYS